MGEPPGGEGGGPAGPAWDVTGSEPGPRLGAASSGAGAGAEAHAAALAGLPGVRLAVVADPDGGRARALGVRHGVPAMDDPEAALARDDVTGGVHRRAEPRPRRAQARAAAERGVAVLVEKPLGRDAGEAQAVLDVCAARGVPLGIVLQNRFAPEAAALHAADPSGGLGRIVGATILVRDHRDAGYFQAGPWRRQRAASGGGVLRIQAIHMLDLLDWMLGPVAAVTASMATRAHPVDVEDVLSATLELPGGAPAALFATTAARVEFPARIEIFGTEGCAVLLEARANVRVWRGPAGPHPLAGIARLEGEMATRLDAPWPGGITADLHRLLLADFVASLREGRAPAVDGAAGLRIQRLIDAIYAAAASGRRTTIPG